jgi:methylated-DNA-protein-cysteine methyltransferase-like protein
MFVKRNAMSRQTFTDEVIEIIREIPRGRVSTYGKIAAAAGSPRGARQVVRVLHTCSESENLPWWRVVNREGRIALKPGYGFEEQADLLQEEGIEVDDCGRVSLADYKWDF